MGAWGVLAFDNDDALDWTYELADADDLGPVEEALAAVEACGSDYLDVSEASNALAACEVIARLKGHPGYINTFTESVDEWVAAHRIMPGPEIVTRAALAIDRIVGPNSELRELWSESDEEEWLSAVSDLRRRVLT